MIRLCAQCGCEFRPSKPSVKFCSHNCHDVSRQLLDAQQIERLARAGESQVEIARQFGVSRSTVRRAIHKYGYEREWLQLRWV